MRFLRNRSLSTKQRVIIVMTSGGALLLACCALLVYDIIHYRRTLADELGVLTRIVGTNCAAAVDFNDRRSAERTLAAMNTTENIVAAAVYDLRGNLFASFQEAQLASVPEELEIGYQFFPNRLRVVSPIEYAGEHIGTIQIISNLDGITERLVHHSLATSIVFLGALIASLILAGRLHRLVSVPILELASLSRAVAQDKNYAVRAQKTSSDEVGQLVDAFNEMLNQIQSRDRDLQDARDHLELRVEERSAELKREVAERKQSEAALLETNDRFELVTLATSDVIFDWNIKTNQIWWSQAIEQVFGYKQKDLDPSTSEFWENHIHPDDRQMILTSMRAATGGRDCLWSHEYRFQRKDGSYADVIDRGYIARDTSGAATRMIGAVQDISERKHSEAKLSDAHEKLLHASRQAGMAEIATNVLHNVGNVLNSVNVSANIVEDTVKQSRSSRLSDVVDLLRSHEQDLGVFLTEDPKGCRIPEYLAKLADYILKERTDIVRELSCIRENIEHIKVIVSMQQNYARASNVTERVDIIDLVEDSLRLSADASGKCRPKIEKKFAAIPPFHVEKHRVLQVLVNLMNNARMACQESERSDMQITVHVERQDRRVRISVADNGVGIPPENLTRIFSHGFTTRENGHGFGLHSSALTAQEMGGSLTAHSEGCGHGATFTLDLPLTLSPSKQVRS